VHALTASKTANWVMAAKRALVNGFWAAVVFNIIVFQSETASAREVTVLSNTVAIMPKVTILRVILGPP
jgi:hypothetical protein